MEIKRIVCTVTNDLNYDQRMIRICSSLAKAGYDVLLVGRHRKKSLPLETKSFQQKRLSCFFDKGKLFYVEYNLRLFIYLLFVKVDIICAIDLDTILPCLFMSKIRSKKRVYDAHELFCEMEEIVIRPKIYKMWKAIEKFTVPQFKHGYTIGDCYANEFEKMYHVKYAIVRNATVLKPYTEPISNERYILYQGAVNEGRSFETLIPAMQYVDCKLIICGEGNFFQQANELVKQFGLQERVIFKGYVEPQNLIDYTRNATIGITLFTNQGKSNYLSMANRFFDYMHSCIPQLCVAYPEYIKVNEEFDIANLISDTKIETIANELNHMLHDEKHYHQMKSNCLRAREVYCWEEQEKTLITFYKNLLG
ncbi:MAG TPA: glycosyltransferase [Chitinophagaceae bacterium]|nr:glycosyltransferase [Chitinophagaceae bacterium]